MTGCIKVLGAKPDEFSSVLRTHRAKKETDS